MLSDLGVFLLVFDGWWLCLGVIDGELCWFEGDELVLLCWVLVIVELYELVVMSECAFEFKSLGVCGG